MNWLSFWASLGIRNEFHKGLPARSVAELNHNYLETCTNYLTKSDLRHEISKRFPILLFVEKEFLAAGNRFGPLVAKLPLMPSLFSGFVHRVVRLRDSSMTLFLVI